MVELANRIRVAVVHVHELAACVLMLPDLRHLHEMIDCSTSIRNARHITDSRSFSKGCQRVQREHAQVSYSVAGRESVQV